MNFARGACFDVYYSENYARACAIGFELDPEMIISKQCVLLDEVNEYVPGQFYRRELPCLLEVYRTIRHAVDLIIIDGYVLLGDGKRGLGGHFYEALGQSIPIIGVAKTYFKGCTDCVRLYRGKSTRPLYITSLGLDCDLAAKIVENLGGENRIPLMLKAVDLISRGLSDKQLSIGGRH